jgi:hypothetical protein
MRFNLNPLILFLLVAGILWAGTTNLSTLTLTPETSSDNALVVNNSGGTNKLVINGSGNITTMSGTVALSGASTLTEDMTLSGDGVDLLFNAANQNTIGAATKGAKAVFTRALTGETSTALTISAGSGITNTAVNTMTGGGIVLTATSAPAQTSSTSAGLLWLTNATPQGGLTANKLYCYINGSWTVLH